VAALYDRAMRNADEQQPTPRWPGSHAGPEVAPALHPQVEAPQALSDPAPDAAAPAPRQLGRMAAFGTVPRDWDKPLPKWVLDQFDGTD